MKGEPVALYFPLMATTSRDAVTKIGMFIAQRQEDLDLAVDNADVVNTYTITINGEIIGEVRHRYGDGGWRLVELGLELHRELGREPSMSTP
jgi:hypothetical protein